MEQVRKEFVTDEKAKKIALHVSGVSVAGNVLLSLFKLLAGIIGHSGAMISDAVHSASDVFGTIIAFLESAFPKENQMPTISTDTTDWSVWLPLCWL